METEQEISNGVRFGFVDSTTPSLARYQPALVSNWNGSVLDTLENELRDAQQFTIAVAFVTLGGLLDLKSTLADIAMHGVRGRLITSTYLGFNHPDVFADLLHIPNLDVRIFEEEGFHTKAYYFDHGEFQSAVIGSANLTQNALKSNYEWNLRVTSTERGDVVGEVKTGLDHLWAEAEPLTTDWIDNYRQGWQPPTKREQPDKNDNGTKQIAPNTMQAEALASLRRLRDEEHAQRGLVVAATGTGKTYMAAFDVQQFHAKRVLFVVHREQILRKAMASFREVLGGHDDDYGILSGSCKQYDAKYLFATVNMASKPEVCERLGAETFDYIIIDEAHRVCERFEDGEQTMYQRLMAFFKPQFMLGMTATPERTDGTNVYRYFDYHLAYEISLLDALDSDLLAPFHYIGVTDYERDGRIIDDTTSLPYLVSDERVNHIIAKTFYYGPREGNVHGLIFVSRVEEGRELADKFKARGIHAQFVSAVDSVETREDAVDKLTKGQLQYIIAVDIFNEGIDIPVLNQVVMMRPTKSSIIFLQQLGRGLRKVPGKEYVTVLDFIGNYDENYMIPMAFDRSHTSNKEKIRKHIISPSIDGVSTIHFEEVARQRILAAVSRARLDDMKRFRTAYTSVSDKICLRLPMLLDFAKFSGVAVADIIKKFRTVHAMQNKFAKVKPPLLTRQQQDYLHFLSREVAVSKRPLEAMILRGLLKRPTLTDSEIKTEMVVNQFFCDDESLTSAARILDLSYFMKANRKKYGGQALVVRTGDQWRLSSTFAGLVEEAFFRNYVTDAVEANLFELAHNGMAHCDRFTIGEKYYRADTIKLLNWENEQNNQNVGGYMLRPDKKFLPVFVALDKTEEFKNKLAYEDELFDRSTLRWFSKPKRTKKSPTEQYVASQKNFGLIQLFVKKKINDEKEGIDFYYLGSAKVLESYDTQRRNADDVEVNLVEFTLRLEHEIELGLYRALTE